ncbi:MAG: DUF2190 family protein [Deltaproteobacteria bacterium]
MKNYIQTGESLEYTAGANITSGSGVLVGKRLGVAATDIANGSKGVLAMRGVFSLPKLSTDVVAQGDELYWDDTNKRLTLTATSNTKAGYAAKAAGNGVATVECALNS